MITVLADGTDGSVGVLVDDPVCGRVLLDCGPGVPTRAVFAGISLAGVVILASGLPVDPGVPEHLVVDVDRVPGARRLFLPDGGSALLLPTSSGPLLHCPSPFPLTAEQVASLPRTVMVTLPGGRPELPGIDVHPLPTRRRVLITGGARSGKSVLAERRLLDEEHVSYLATGPAPGPDDTEWQQRIQTHRDRRPAGWTTVETTDAAGILRATDPSPVLFDCVGTWLTAAMDAAGSWEGLGDDQLAVAIEELVDAWAGTGRTVIAVTNEVGAGVVPATSSGRRFRDELGRLNSRLAAIADEVWLCTAGIGQRLR